MPNTIYYPGVIVGMILAFFAGLTLSPVLALIFVVYSLAFVALIWKMDERLATHRETKRTP
ncbi:hypothetical protein FDI69_gp034 [Rhodococcus phage Trina]|uniref:Uncharacterized protein n=1 Tax=Rhodococcus phage Trina TaxID=2027905 RepID=A0A2D0ZMW6_9CAUD|nr:hypothetical protein FDI69_gp034 [Rhodococcus phage Trina]ASZ74851.1 hypothetical protein SEA_TRINA_34 [Rhodococcus phage Trina]